MKYSIDDLNNRKLKFPKQSKKRGEKDFFVVIPGFLAPNGMVDNNNPIFKESAYEGFGWKYMYTIGNGKNKGVVEITVDVKNIKGSIKDVLS